MILSKSDERVLEKHIKPMGEMAVIPRKGVFRTASTKKLAHHCYCNNILFYWSANNYYFKKGYKK